MPTSEVPTVVAAVRGRTFHGWFATVLLLSLMGLASRSLAAGMDLLWSIDSATTTATYDTSTGLWYVALEGYRSTTTTRPSMIKVVDPVLRKEVGAFVGEEVGRTIRRLRIEGKTLYCLTAGGYVDTALRIFDISVPAAVKRVPTPTRLVVKPGDTTGINSGDFDVRGGVVLAEQGFSGGIVVDYRIPSSPKVLAEGGGLNGGYSGLVGNMIPVDGSTTIMNDGYANYRVTWNGSGVLQYKKWHYLSQLYTQKGTAWHAPTQTYLQNWNAPGDTVALRWWRGLDSGWFELRKDDPSLSGSVPGLALDGDDLWIVGKDSAALLKYDMSVVPPRFVGKFKGNLASYWHGWGGNIVAAGGMVLVTRSGAGTTTHLYGPAGVNSAVEGRRPLGSDLAIRSEGRRLFVRNSGSHSAEVQLMRVSGQLLEQFTVAGSAEIMTSIPGHLPEVVFVSVRVGESIMVKRVVVP
jgi:hypothetical protein